MFIYYMYSMHKNAKLTERIRKEIFEKKQDWQTLKNLSIYYHVHLNIIRKVCKRWKQWDFTVHKSTREDYRSLEYWLKRLLKIEEKINKKKERKEIIRYERKAPGDLLHIDLYKL